MRLGLALRTMDKEIDPSTACRETSLAGLMKKDRVFVRGDQLGSTNDEFIDDRLPAVRAEEHVADQLRDAPSLPGSLYFDCVRDPGRQKHCDLDLLFQATPN